MIQLTYEPIDIPQALEAVRSPRAGAIVLFVGSTREFTDGRRTRLLTYECYADMARNQLARLEDQARLRWQLVDVCIVHRLGEVEVGADSVVIAVSSAHREAAFQAGQWLIDTIKEAVPIWKREFWADGQDRWVHPGVSQDPEGQVSPPDEHHDLASHQALAVSRRRGPLVDRLGRRHNNLRISVTDRCNIRCLYCMPAEPIRFRPRHELLTFEEIERFVRVVVQLGIDGVRITGGEPLVRDGLPVLIAKLSRIEGLRDIAMTTNGILLAEHAAALRQAGLQRLNISLDCLDEDTFQQITRRSGLDRVLDGIAEARRVGFDRIRLNAVALRGMTSAQVIPLADFARRHDLQLRFIEFMPLDGDERWEMVDVVPGEEVRQQLEAHFGRLVPAPRKDDTQPAVDYQFADGLGTVGFIDSVTQPFCPQCNRLRITAEGQLRNCLFSTAEWDARALLRTRGTDDQIADLVHACVAGKKLEHGSDAPEFVRPGRPMNELGG